MDDHKSNFREQSFLRASAGKCDCDISPTAESTAQCDSLTKINTDLIDALDEMLKQFWPHPSDYLSRTHPVVKAFAAIAKANGNTAP